MKAVRIYEFGGSSVLQLDEIECPVPGDNDILLKVYASVVKAVDWAVQNGGNDILKPYLKRPMTLGWDVAGVVEAVGKNVSAFKPGDAVFGEPDFSGSGSYAEYLVANASQFAAKPHSLSYTEAAAVPLAGLKLSRTKLTVSEIAFELGFEHIQSFSKLFKSKTSQTPVEFRAAFN